MKKKKLKKKIKKLRGDVKWLKECERRLAVNHMNFRDSLSKQQDDISKLKDSKDSKDCKDDIKELNNRIDGVFMDTNHLRSEVRRINERCDILDRRTQTYYDKIIPTAAEETKNGEKTCDSCDYHGLSGCGTQCAECPANNKKEGDINAN